MAQNKWAAGDTTLVRGVKTLYNLYVWLVGAYFADVWFQSDHYWWILSPWSSSLDENWLIGYHYFLVLFTRQRAFWEFVPDFLLKKDFQLRFILSFCWFLHPEKPPCRFYINPKWINMMLCKMKKEAIYLPNMNFVDISGVFRCPCWRDLFDVYSSWRILDSFSLSVAFLKVAAARSQVEEAYVCCELVSW